MLCPWTHGVQVARPSAANSLIHICYSINISSSWILAHPSHSSATMQTFRCVSRHVALRPKVCSIWSPTSATTSRNFLNCPVWNLSSKHLGLSEDSALSTKPDLEEDSKLSDDPELRKWRRQQDRNARSRNRYATDLTWRDRNLALASIYRRNRYTTDQDYRNHVLENSRKDYAMKMNTIPHYAIAMALRYWVYRSRVAREQLFWKTHIPILTSEKWKDTVPLAV